MVIDYETLSISDISSSEKQSINCVRVIIGGNTSSVSVSVSLSVLS